MKARNTLLSPRKRRWLVLGLAAVAAGSLLRERRQRMRAAAWNRQMNARPGRTALITGASSGIGAAYARRLGRMGSRLVLTARREERLAALAADIQQSYGVLVEIIAADLSTDSGISRLEHRLASAELPPVDFLVNNAGYDVFGAFAEIPIEKTLGLINCLELATVRLTRAALPGMLARREGTIVNVSSIGAYVPKPKDATYVASKAYVSLFSESLAAELHGSGVRVQALVPGFTLTEFHDAPVYEQYHIKERIPRWLWLTPEQVVEASLDALSHDQKVCIPGWQNRLIAAAGRSGLSSVLMDVLRQWLPGETARESRVNQALYHRFAPYYDRMFRPYTRKGRQRAIDLLNLQAGENLLIAGVGTGLDLPLLPKSIKVTGVDISQEMLRLAQLKPAPAQTTLCIMDAQALEFPDESFDAVLLNLILSVVPDGTAAFREAWRVLKPGGRLAVFDKFLPESGHLTFGRRALGRIFAAIGTDPNRRFSEVIKGSGGGVIEKDEPVLLNGQYRAILLKKQE